MQSNRTQPNLDLILDQALDDFEEQSLVEKASAVQASNKNAESESNESSNERMLLQSKLLEQKKMEELLQTLQDPLYGATLQSTLKSLSSTNEGIETVDGLFAQLAKQFEQQHKSTLYPDNVKDQRGMELTDREVAATMQMIGGAQKGMEGFEPSKIEETAEGMMEEMVSQFEELGEKEDYNEVVDGVMRQLLSKDLMYDPTKQICDKFPEWLATHRRSLSESEYQNYGKQYQTFQKILAVYDTEPDNFPR
jgi:signal recognition particle GTPase